METFRHKIHPVVLEKKLSVKFETIQKYWLFKARLANQVPYVQDKSENSGIEQTFDSSKVSFEASMEEV